MYTDSNLYKQKIVGTNQQQEFRNSVSLLHQMWFVFCPLQGSRVDKHSVNMARLRSNVRLFRSLDTEAADENLYC
jgi:hypothetical protein